MHGPLGQTCIAIMKSRVQQTPPVANDETWLELVRQVGSLDYGTVQIERTEKVRLANPIASSAGPV